MWAIYHWANSTKELKERAVEILLAFASSGFDYMNDIEIELSGLLLQYRSILIISDWQELKEKKNYNEISHGDFAKLREEQKQTCKDIHDKHGVSLYNNLVSRKLDEISSGARQNTIAGLYSFLEVLIRLQKIHLALEICEFILYSAPEAFHAQFKKKQKWLLTFQRRKDVEKNS